MEDVQFLLVSEYISIHVCGWMCLCVSMHVKFEAGCLLQSFSTMFLGQCDLLKLEINSLARLSGQ